MPPFWSGLRIDLRAVMGDVASCVLELRPLPVITLAPCSAHSVLGKYQPPPAPSFQDLAIRAVDLGVIRGPTVSFGRPAGDRRAVRSVKNEVGRSWLPVGVEDPAPTIPDQPHLISLIVVQEADDVHHAHHCCPVKPRFSTAGFRRCLLPGGVGQGSAYRAAQRIG